jgi:16S rRNA G966 N2-methylase RsmD
MNDSIFHPNEWQDWLSKYEDRNVTDLALEFSKRKDLPLPQLLTQIKGRQTAKFKLPTWYQHNEIVYPDSLALEQCSGEIAAKFKAEYFKANNILDLTGGLGVDTWAFSLNSKRVHYNEPDLHRMNSAKHNLNILKCDNIIFSNQTAENYLINTNENFDLIYLDPSRRIQGKKVFLLKDLQPDILELKNKLSQLSKNIVVKVGPMLDIQQAIRDLKTIKQIIIVSVKNECKELLINLDYDNEKSTQIHAVELHGDKQYLFSFSFEEERSSDLKIGSINDWIYDPFASIIKSGGFKVLTHRFNINALHPNTHLYTSNSKVDEFPGRIFKVEEVLPYDLKNLKKQMQGKRATLLFRNFPDKAEDVTKKLNIPADEFHYLLFVTNNLGEKKVISCLRII